MFGYKSLDELEDFFRKPTKGKSVEDILAKYSQERAKRIEDIFKKMSFK